MLNSKKDATSGKFVAHLTDAERKSNRRRSVARYNQLRRDGKTGALTQRAWNLFYKYGIIESEFFEILASQGNGCAICGETLNLGPEHGVKSRFHVDHDHASGRVRGVLCFRCNAGLGSYRDNIDLLINAAAYLERAKSEAL